MKRIVTSCIILVMLSVVTVQVKADMFDLTGSGTGTAEINGALLSSRCTIALMLRHTLCSQFLPSFDWGVSQYSALQRASTPLTEPYLPISSIRLFSKTHSTGDNV